MLWKTQNQQNKKLQNGKLVALLRGSASTIILGGDAKINRDISLSLLEARQKSKRQPKNSNQRMEMSQTRQPSAKTVN